MFFFCIKYLFHGCFFYTAWKAEKKVNGSAA